MAAGATLIQAAIQFLAALSAEKQAEARTEVHRFVQWCGQDRPLASLTPLDMENYAESRLGAADVLQRLAPVRAFLQFGHKEGLTTANLAPHLRVRKVSSKARQGPAAQAAGPKLTTEGREKVLKELEEQRAKRPVLADEIKRAAADKDFRENAPLEAAREELGHVEAHIRELEALLRGGVVSAPTEAKAAVGSLVRLKDVQSGEEMEYALVGPREAAPARGLISANSPVGQAMLGHSPGEEVEVATPAGRFRYRILSVGPR
ncbi:MAG: GreA/GreB family elongation factor [Chloroflexi bacterium]|nr:GreA/GreB family elongation factor [Chloroflexota bacterium]